MRGPKRTSDPTASLDCEGFRRLIDLDDVDARIDRRRLAEHLSCCSSCADFAPELVFLLGRPAAAGLEPAVPMPSRRGSLRRRVAGLAVAALALWVLRVAVDRPAEPEGSGSRPVEVSRLDSPRAPSGRAIDEPAALNATTRVTVDRQRSFASTVAHRRVASTAPRRPMEWRLP